LTLSITRRLFHAISAQAVLITMSVLTIYRPSMLSSFKLGTLRTPQTSPPAASTNDILTPHTIQADQSNLAANKDPEPSIEIGAITVNIDELTAPSTPRPEPEDQ